MRDLALTTGDMSLRAAWNPPTSSGSSAIRRYELEYKRTTVAAWTPLAPGHSVSATATVRTISGLTNGSSYDVQVRACNSHRCGPWSQDTGMPRDSVITIARHANTGIVIDEGDDATFRLKANPAPAADLEVQVSITETPQGAFLDPGESLTRSFTISARQTTEDFTIRTVDDFEDEVDGRIRVEVQPDDTKYVLGNPFLRNVDVLDDDQPDAPAELRANGNLNADNEITVRWESVSEATGYGVRYVREVCKPNGVCETDSVWQEETTAAPSSPPVAVEETTFDGPSEGTLYRVQARSTVVSDSFWSHEDFALVYPTDSPLRGGTVATAPFHGYQAKNSNGSHEFRYVMCTATVSSEVTTSPSNPSLSRTQLEIIEAIEGAVGKWEEAVIWDRGGHNIITTESYRLPGGENCKYPLIPGTEVFSEIPDEEGRFEIKFVDDGRIERACDLLDFRLAPVNGCWRSESWELPGTQQIHSGVILLNASLGADHWNARFGGADGCTNLHELVIHEAGHAFGIGNRTGLDFNRHPINTMHSIMSYDDPGRYCEPQAYDIVALMALYQSR